MQISHTLLLGAGHGTRMGDIGKTLPKVLWPVFEKPLFMLQYELLNKVIDSSYSINTHHQAKLIHDYINQNNLKISYLFEDSILGSGGAIHNFLKSVNFEKGILLFCNSDMFLNISNEDIKLALKKLEDSDVVLFTQKTETDSTFNRLKIGIDRELLSVVRPSINSPTVTYAGIGICRLESIDYIKGASSFFDTIANYDVKKVSLANNIDSIDFGTLDSYFENMQLVLRDEDLKNRLIKLGFIDQKKINKFSYNHPYSEDNILNFSKNHLPKNWGRDTIIFPDTIVTKYLGPGIYYKELFIKA